MYFFDFFKYNFWLDFWHNMFFMRRYITINAGQCCLLINPHATGQHNTLKLWWLSQHTFRTFNSSFEENCRWIVNYSLSWKKKKAQLKLSAEWIKGLFIWKFELVTRVIRLIWKLRRPFLLYLWITWMIIHWL